MLMRTRNETLLEHLDYNWDDMFEPIQYSSDWERIIDSTYEYEAHIRAERTQSTQTQNIQK